MAETFLEKTQFIYNGFDKRLAREYFSKQAELFHAYAALDLRLQDALELSSFEDLHPELEREAKEIEAILADVNLHSEMTGEHDWCGAFVTIKGTTTISGRSWLERNPERDFEDVVIQGLSAYLGANFICSRCYSTYHAYYPYDSYSRYHQEVTIFVSDLYAYGRLKDEAGYHSLFRRNKRMDIFIEILPATALPSVIQETSVFPLMVYGAASPYISQNLSGACIIHLPTRIQARSSEGIAFLFNHEIASMLLQSRLHAYYLGDKHRKPRYAYLWDNQQMIDHSKHDTYLFSQADGFANAIIKSLEKSAKFQEK